MARGTCPGTFLETPRSLRNVIASELPFLPVDKFNPVTIPSYDMGLLKVPERIRYLILRAPDAPREIRDRKWDKAFPFALGSDGQEIGEYPELIVIHPGDFRVVNNFGIHSEPAQLPLYLPRYPDIIGRRQTGRDAGFSGMTLSASLLQAPNIYCLPCRDF